MNDDSILNHNNTTSYVTSETADDSPFMDFTIFLEPRFSDQTSVADDADTWQLKILFTEPNQLPQEFSPVGQEGFPPREVDLLHA